MDTIFMERNFDEVLSTADVQAMAMDGADCAALHRIDWLESFLSEDGHTLMCCFTAPDAESVRILVEGDTSREKVIRPGTLHDTTKDSEPNVAVVRNFDEPVDIESLQATEDAGAWCLETYNVTFLRTYFSKDRKHMVCFYKAPDAESVRLAQEQAGMPVDRVWACRRYGPETLFA